jgi:hypothetical protein
MLFTALFYQIRILLHGRVGSHLYLIKLLGKLD